MPSKARQLVVSSVERNSRKAKPRSTLICALMTGGPGAAKRLAAIICALKWSTSAISLTPAGMPPTYKRRDCRAAAWLALGAAAALATAPPVAALLGSAAPDGRGRK
jgi:hypothetical protein